MDGGAALMLAFDGDSLPDWMEGRIGAWQPAGITLFRRSNMSDGATLRRLTRALQAANRSELPLLIATDQEGGQLIALGDIGTPFAGNMALGAAGDADLARRVGHAIGVELSAVGINVDYAPVCDVASRPDNPSLGIRSFGDDPAAVGRLAAAFTVGLQEAGVAATAKHFPGKGEATTDPHYELPVLDLDLERLDSVELASFRDVISAGVKLMMIGHYALPAITGRRDLPATLSPDVVNGLLRRRLGFDGVIITDALDMGAVTGSDGLPDVAAALGAGVDLLLCTQNPDIQDAVHRTIGAASAPARVRGLRQWVGGHHQPPLEVLGCSEHHRLAAEVARRSITLVRDHARLLPLDRQRRVLAVMPEPTDLTPADTSSWERPGLASALRRLCAGVTEVVTEHTPTAASVDALAAMARDHDVAVVGTVSAGPEQAAMVRRLVATGTPTVAIALRTPGDLTLYPQAGTYICTYGLLEPSLIALSDALFGDQPFAGRLPAAINGLYPTGHCQDER
ncbi:MAG TPA: glycoside hydrolase family 3 N-terminal domain-containing protein [Acidimicrobiia bacterium]|nr:glycoside hydrolase family 3 N-terminal domain-containing protein [Acidimicrobiia bacterium]